MHTIVCILAISEKGYQTLRAFPTYRKDEKQICINIGSEKVHFPIMNTKFTTDFRKYCNLG